MIRHITAIVGCTVLILALSACKETPQDPPILLFSTSAADYLYKGGKGSTWEYVYSESTIDTTGKVTKSPEDGMLIKFTLLDSGVTRKDVAHLTVMLRQNFIKGVLDDTDTLYYTNHVGSVVNHRLPRFSIVSKSVVIADPIVKGASFWPYADTTDTKVFMDEVDVQVQTQAGLFRCVNLRGTYTDTLDDGSIRANVTRGSIAPWNHFITQTNVETTKFPSGKVMVETSSVSIVKIDVKK